MWIIDISFIIGQFYSFCIDGYGRNSKNCKMLKIWSMRPNCLESTHWSFENGPFFRNMTHWDDLTIIYPLCNWLLQEFNFYGSRWRWNGVHRRGWPSGKFRALTVPILFRWDDGHWCILNCKESFNDIYICFIILLIWFPFTKFDFFILFWLPADQQEFQPIQAVQVLRTRNLLCKFDAMSISGVRWSIGVALGTCWLLMGHFDWVKCSAVDQFNHDSDFAHLSRSL